jgi:hypothetical protein
MSARLLCAIASVFLIAVGMHAQQNESRIYSNVEYNEEGGDLLGVELRVTTNGSHATGELKIYEGGCASPVEMSGSLTGNKLDLSGKSDMYGKIKFAGAIRDEKIEGVLSLEKSEKPEKLQLKKILNPHC